MPMRFPPALLAAALLASGCGERPAAPQPGAFNRQLQALDRAKAVEQTMQDQSADRRKAIDEAEGR